MIALIAQKQRCLLSSHPFTVASGFVLGLIPKHGFELVHGGSRAPFRYKSLAEIRVRQS